MEGNRKFLFLKRNTILENKEIIVSFEKNDLEIEFDIPDYSGLRMTESPYSIFISRDEARELANFILEHLKEKA